MLCKSLGLAATVALLMAAGCSSPPQWLTRTDAEPSAADAPLSAGDLATIAEKFAEQGHYQKARELCDEALRREPDEDQSARLLDLIARCDVENVPKVLPDDGSVHEALAALETALDEARAADAARDAVPAKLLSEGDVQAVSFSPPADAPAETTALPTITSRPPVARSVPAAGPVTQAAARTEPTPPAVPWSEACALAPKTTGAGQPGRLAPAIVPRSATPPVADAPPESPADEWEPLIEPGKRRHAVPAPTAADLPKPLVRIAPRPEFEEATPSPAPARTVATAPGLWSPMITPGTVTARSPRVQTIADDEWEPVPGSR